MLRIEPGDAIKIVIIYKAKGIDLELATAIESIFTEWSGPKTDDL